MLTIGRGVTLPFLTIYLTEHYHLLPESVGLIMGASLAIGIFSSLYGGYLVDRFSHRTLIGFSVSLFALSFFTAAVARRRQRGDGHRPAQRLIRPSQYYH